MEEAALDTRARAAMRGSLLEETRSIAMRVGLQCGFFEVLLIDRCRNRIWASKKVKPDALRTNGRAYNFRMPWPMVLIPGDTVHRPLSSVVLPERFHGFLEQPRSCMSTIIEMA